MKRASSTSAPASAASRTEAAPLASAKTIEDGGSEITGQLALSDFISSGELDRHLRRTRPVYRDRRDTLLSALAGLEVEGVETNRALLQRVLGHADFAGATVTTRWLEEEALA